jgi:hypothetical protein
MASSMSENSKRINVMARVNSFGKMVESTKEVGYAENSLGRATTRLITGRSAWDFGLMASAKSG